MPFGAPGFFRDHPSARKPVQYEVTLVYENLYYAPPPGGAGGDAISKKLQDPATIRTLQAALEAAGVGVISERGRTAYNTYSLATNIWTWVDVPFAGSVQSWPTYFSVGVLSGQSLINFWQNLMPSNERYLLTGANRPVQLASGTHDVTGAVYALAVRNPREPSLAASPQARGMPYRRGAGRLMVSFSHYQAALTQQANVVAAFVAPNPDHFFVGVNSLRITHADAPPGGVFFGAVLSPLSSSVTIVGSFNGSLTYNTAPLDGLVIEYGSEGTTTTNTVTQYTAMTVDQIINGPIEFPGSTFQRVNTPHLAFKAGGAVFDITHDLDEVIEAIGQTMGRYAFELS